MKGLIVGAGAVGGYFGAKLARAGHDVTFTARGENLRVLQAAGLKIESVDGDFHIRPVHAVESARGAGPFSFLLVCVKAQDTESALAGLGGEIGEGALVISLQNGVDSEPTIERVLGIPRMLRALAYIGAELVAPGVVRRTSGGTIVVGEIDDSRSERLTRLEPLLREAAIDFILPESILRAKWQKLAWNAAFNVVSALSGAVIGEILARAPARALIQATMAEVEAVANAEGVKFEEDYARRVIRHAEQNLGSVRPSTLQDRERGRPLEHRALTGAVVRLGERHGIATPISRTLDALAEIVSAGGAGSPPHPPPPAKTEEAPTSQGERE